MRGLLQYTLMACALSAACVTPVIPLPPPAPATMAISQVDPDKQQVVLSGGKSDPHGGVLFHIYHPASGKGQIVQAAQDGSFVSDPITAAEGDRLEVWATRFIAEGDPSSVICILVSYDSGKPLQECSY